MNSRYCYIATALILLAMFYPRDEPVKEWVNPFGRIETNNPDSLAMMYYCRGRNDSLFLIKIQYNLIK